MTSTLIETVPFTKQTKDGADVKFVRQYKGVNYTIYAGWNTAYVSWFQWGAPKEVIAENAPTARAFFANKLIFKFGGFDGKHTTARRNKN